MYSLRSPEIIPPLVENHAFLVHQRLGLLAEQRTSHSSFPRSGGPKLIANCALLHVSCTLDYNGVGVSWTTDKLTPTLRLVSNSLSPNANDSGD